MAVLPLPGPPVMRTICLPLPALASLTASKTVFVSDTLLIQEDKLFALLDLGGSDLEKLFGRPLGTEQEFVLPPSGAAVGANCICKYSTNAPRWSLVNSEICRSRASSAEILNPCGTRRCAGTPLPPGRPDWRSER